MRREGEGRGGARGSGGLPLTPQLTDAAAGGLTGGEAHQGAAEEDMRCMGQIDEDRVWRKRKSCRMEK